MAEKPLNEWLDEFYANKSKESEQKGRVHVKHGACIRHPELYSVWSSMRMRCNNPNRNSYQRYGGRGIKVCPEWDGDAGAFVDWAIENGYEKGLQLDRIDNDKGCNPDNCRWVTPSENCRNKGNNKRITLCGITKTVAEWCETLEIREFTIYSWIREFGKEGCERRIYRRLAGEYEEEAIIEELEEIRPYTDWNEFLGVFLESEKEAISISCDTEKKASDTAKTLRSRCVYRNYNIEIMKKKTTVYALKPNAMKRYTCSRCE